MSKNRYSLVVVVKRKDNDVASKILKQTISTLEKKKKDYKVIDLVADSFNPTYEPENLALYSRGETNDENVKKYQKLILGANELIYIYKAHLSGPEAMFKGFLDKTFLKDTFWHIRQVVYFGALWGTMGYIKRTVSLVYQDEDKQFYNKSKRAIKYQITRGTCFALHSRGIKMELLTNATNETQQTKFYKKINKIVGKAK